MFPFAYLFPAFTKPGRNLLTFTTLPSIVDNILLLSSYLPTISFLYYILLFHRSHELQEQCRSYCIRTTRLYLMLILHKAHLTAVYPRLLFPFLRNMVLYRPQRVADRTLLIEFPRLLFNIMDTVIRLILLIRFLLLNSNVQLEDLSFHPLPFVLIVLDLREFLPLHLLPYNLVLLLILLHMFFHHLTFSLLDNP